MGALIGHDDGGAHSPVERNEFDQQDHRRPVVAQQPTLSLHSVGQAGTHYLIGSSWVGAEHRAGIVGRLSQPVDDSG
jgi:hypothetical protein